MTNVPSQYQPLVADASQQTGMPQSVVAAQINEESGFDPNAVSPANAEGMFQFLPSTYTGLGFPAGTEFNPSEEEKAYVAYMKQLLSQEGGSVFKALEAYNAGPANLGAGAGYANAILGAAGTGTNITAGAGANATTAGFLNNPLGYLFPIEPLIQSAIGKVGSSFLSQFGIGNAKDFFIRLGFILLGAILIIVGIVKMFDVQKAAGTAAEVGGAGIALIPGAEEVGLGVANAGHQVKKQGVVKTAQRKAEGRARRFSSRETTDPTGSGEATRQIERSAKQLAPK